MNKKRIIIIRNAKSYDFGGGERFPVFLAEELKKFDFSTLIISRSPKLLSFADGRQIRNTRGLWWANQNWSGKFALLFPVYFVWQLVLSIWYFTVFIRENPNVIHIQSKDDFIAATIAGKMLGKQIIWTDHADLKHIWKNITIWYKNPVGKLVHWSARFTNIITVVSKSELSLISANLKVNDITRKKMKVVYNGVTDAAKEYPQKTNKNFAYCVVSRLVADKGIGEVIEAFNRLTNNYPNDKLLIVGDGPEAEKFKTLAKNNPNIKFLGYQKDPLKYIAKSNVFVHPAHHEGFGIALVEASMLSKPIIATAVGGIIEIITDHETGLLVKEKNIDSLKKAMKLLRNNKTLRNKLGKAARAQYEQRFQFDQVVRDEYIPLYKGVKK